MAKKYVCEECGKAFKTKEVYTIHMTEKHKGKDTKKDKTAGEEEEKEAKQKEEKSKEQIPKKKKSKKQGGLVYLLLALVLAVILILNIITVGDIRQKLESNKTPDEIKAANIKMILLVDKSCPDCYDIDAVAAKIRSNKQINVTLEKEVEYDTDAAKKLIEALGIVKIPTMIITGEIEGLSLKDFTEKQDSLFFNNPAPPYTNAVTGEQEGLVTITMITDSECGNCTDLSMLIPSFEALDLQVGEEQEIDYQSEEGQEILEQYNITKVPALLLSKDAGAYDKFVQIWTEDIGRTAEDGTYIMSMVFPPYVDVKTGKMRGLVKLTMLTDESCTECYDVTIHKQALANYGMVYEEENLIDISTDEGKELLERYNITKVPTIILSSEAQVYTQLIGVWAGIGTVEDDGSLVFREMNALASALYKDLETGNVTGASAPTPIAQVS